MTDEKLKVQLGGLPQKIHIISDDEEKPVLLFLHGGPGVVNRHAISGAHRDLLDTFTLVGWDQRGSGGSCKGAKKETLTVERLTDDAAELAEWLCKRFKKDKIFILGGSWGSELGTWLAYRFPKRIAAYVGFGQVVDGALNEELSFSFAMEQAKAANDEKAVKSLLSVGPPQNGVYKGGLKGLMAQRNVMMKYGGYSPSKAKRGFFSSLVKPMILSGEYSASDLFGAAVGHKKVLEAMWPEVGATKLAKTCPIFEVPYFIFDGRLDYNTPASLVEDYFNEIEAPVKELIWFENSGHNPMGDEPDRFKQLLREKLKGVASQERKRGTAI
jgi:pimeloyl-ACP methyl ester carboxylesterase